ncbi:MAG: hypothetical protein A2W91_09235 [Bacteroidetes bacterium GWF2_38_335]|nr:MAG: hypothetical protein A2W91_09235 [Bacteroidetes bacterium GWF2_38_335]OFY80550.1 MAG: hypothetical protein A2281_08960 [Bacteroidetes bacterium RIFOXYA12_FULL_38_20]HBS85834.1 ATP-binding protein [Bacteroidales bacterium]
MDTYIKKLIEQGEHQQQDFKFEISDSRKIAKTLVAFSNTDGGKLLVGVKDNGVVAGVRSEEEFYMVEGAASLYCKPTVLFTTKQWKVDGRTVLEIDIPKSDTIPHYAQNEEKKWLAYIRKHDQNLLVSHVQLEVWKREKSGKPVYIEFRENEKLLFDFLDRKNEITLSKFIKLTRISSRDAQQILINLILLQIIEIDFTGQQALYRLKEGFDVILESMKYR